MEYVRKRPTLKLWVRIVLGIFLIIGIFLPIGEIFLHSVRIKSKNNEIIYTYRINQNVNYKVQLYENNFTNTTEMESNKIYISDLVKNIPITFNYSYNGNHNSDLDYSYYIKAKLYGENQNASVDQSTVVWEKDYTLLEPIKKRITGTSGFGITEVLNIDYPSYKDEVLKFKSKFGMSLTTKLRVTMNVKVKGEYENEPINKKEKIVLDIPVGTQAFSITEDYKKDDLNHIYNKVKDIELENTSYALTCGIISFISFILFMFFFKAIFNVKPKSSYTKQLEKIIKNYDEVIVEVETPIKEKGYTIAQVKSFEEMLDLEEELRIPIIFYESPYRHVSTFTVTHNDVLYKYTLKSE